MALAHVCLFSNSIPSATSLTSPSRFSGAVLLPILLSRRLRDSQTFYTHVRTTPNLCKISVPTVTLGCGTLPGFPDGNRRVLASISFSTSMENPLFHDVCVATLASGFALLLLRFWEEMAKRGVFGQILNRKLVHISIGLTFLLFWPFFSSGHEAAFLASLAPGMNVIRVLLLGLGKWKNDALVKSMSRHGDYRELLKGPLYYGSTITLATLFFWRTSPIAISAICNLCAGDGFADIVGRRFGTRKLPYNRDKSVAGSFAMACAGFMASVGYLYYFSLFGLIQVSSTIIFGFFIVSLATAIVESLPISAKLDDNLTVPFTSLLVGSIVL